MKIVHISLSGAYTDNLSYQENYLSKYHQKMGLDTYLIASEWMYDDNGNYTKCKKQEYVDDFGVKVIRLKMKGEDRIDKPIRRYYGLMDALERINPDIIFHHGCQSVEEKTVIKYCKKNKNVVLYVDNHADFSNSASTWLSKNIQHKILWRWFAKRINPYVKKFYGVLPARVDFLVDLYGLPKEKVELLVMGADDDLVSKADTPELKHTVRAQYNISDDDFLIMSGGKIDLFKQQVLYLMDAVNEIQNPKVKLIVFGSVVDELKEEVAKRCSDKVQYIGWIKSVDSYKHFAASDLVVFPGRHSVFWEQVAGQGIPMIIKYWNGTTHVECGGNTILLKDDSVNEISKAITMSIDNYSSMKNAAEANRSKFMYGEISRKSIDL